MIEFRHWQRRKTPSHGIIGRAFLGLLAGSILCGVCVSCVGQPPAIASDNPDKLIPAIKAGVVAHDKRIIPYLVQDLQSNDGAIRFYAIDGLRRLTGQDLGYVYYGDADQRKAACERWQRWLAKNKP